MRKHPWLTAILALLVLCAGVYFFIQWRAEWRWQHYATAARARGVKLLLADFVPPEIPDAQNFAALPMLRAAFAGQAHPLQLPDRPGGQTISLGPVNVTAGNRPGFGDPVSGHSIDWPEWQQYFVDVGLLTAPADDPIHDVLRALEHDAPEFQEWSQWRTRPLCRFPLDIVKRWNAGLPHLAVFTGASQVFALRMRAHRALGDAPAAYADFREGFQAYHALRDEPLLIAGLIRTSVLETLIAAVGDGLKAHAWGADELSKIEADLATVRVWDDYLLTFASERASQNSLMEMVIGMSRAERAKFVATLGGGTPNTSLSLLVQWLPRSFIRDNQLRLNQYFDELLTSVDASKQEYHPDAPTPSAPENIEGAFHQAYYALGLLAAPVYRDVARHSAVLQIHLDEVRLACALERYRLSRGTYPESLAELRSEFIDHLPTDLFARAPYRYHRTENRTYHLYSVGPNHRDEGGAFDPKTSKKRDTDPIWLYAPPAVP